jgi:Galactose oxidase, central domain/Kelch motif
VARQRKSHLLLAAAFAVSALVSLPSTSGHCQTLPGGGPGALATASVATWTDTGRLNTAHSGHTATLLPSGKVLVVGGESGEFVLDTAELYDPASGTWSLTGSLGVRRRSHTATLLSDGRVLVAGGFGGPAPGPDYGYLGSAELYDPATGTWSFTGNLDANRAGHEATLLQNGKVLVAGDFFADNRISELYDPATGTWAATGALTHTRSFHAQTRLPDGNVLVAGGLIEGALDDDTVIPSAEVYDVASGTWSAVEDLAIAVRAVDATLLPNGKVMLAGGASNGSVTNVPIPQVATQVFDWSTRNWSSAGDMSIARYDHSTTTLRSGKVLAVGGADASHANVVELFDATTGAWTRTADIGKGRAGHTATLLPSGKVLVAGGYDKAADYASLDSAEVYTPVPDSSFRVTYLFSNRSGSAQFLQLSELSGLDDQDKLAGHRLTTISTTGVTKQFTFPNDLPSTSTRYKAIALGTSNNAFVDYIIPAGFLPTDGGTIYFGETDSWTFGPMPVDGHTILARAENATSLRDFLDRTYQPIWVIDNVVEYYHQALDHYFMTVSQPEIDALDSGRIGGWRRTGVTIPTWITRDIVNSLVDGPFTPPPGLAGVCRYYIPPAQGDSHFFSASGTECAIVPTAFPAFVLETASAFFATLPDPVSGVCRNGQVPVYRVWNGRLDSNHRYLTSIVARNGMVQGGYIAEGYGPDSVTLCVAGFG